MMKKELIFLGPPACGKGTQTSRLAQHFGFPHIDTGSLLRAEMKSGSENGKTAKQYVDKGLLVPVEIVGNIIKDRLKQDDCKNGFILDGFPRSLEQAEILENIKTELDGENDVDFRATYFEINPDILISRIVNRRSCPKCGEIYNLKYKAPKTENKCDICNEELTQRKDDNEETAKARFDTYYNETSPLIEYYTKKGVLKSIDADGSIDEVWERLLKAVE